MSKLLRKATCLGLAIVMLFTTTANIFAASNSSYVEGNPENIVITFEQVQGSTYEVKIRNDRENAIGNWSLSFKTNFGLSNPVGVDWSISKNNTYTFWDVDNGSIASRDSFSFTVVSDKKKNSEIHNVVFDYKDVEETDTCKVTFDYNYEGSPTAEELKVKSGQIVSPLVKPHRDGYMFIGWYNTKTASITKTPFDFVNNPINSDVTFYARWFKETAQLADGEIDNLYIEYAIIPNLVLRGMDTSDIRLSDDYDGDGLTLIEEYNIDTNPFSEDTDEDGLSDYDEVHVYSTNPLKKDTDGDGLSDGKEILFGGNPISRESEFSFTTEYDNQNGINTSVSITLNGSQAESFEIDKLTDFSLLPSDMPGFIDDAYNFVVDGTFDQANISFRFDEKLLDDPKFDPVIYYFDEEEQVLVPLDTVVAGNIATATVSHFSKYILLDKTKYEESFEWLDVWQESDYNSTNVAFVIDDSGSMSWNDDTNQRLVVTRDLIDALPVNSRASIISFGTGSVIKSWTDDREALKSFLTTNYFHSRSGTCMYQGINAGLNLFGEGDTKTLKIMVVLTDGETTDTSLHFSVLNLAKEMGVRIYTVGLGSSSSSYFTNYLKPVAEETGGRFYLASQVEELSGIYQDIGKYIDIETDSDGDGIPDYFEDHMTLFNGGRMKLDKYDPDTDGDGLYDGEEIELSFKYSADRKKVKVTGKMYSNPTEKDSDDDGLDDVTDYNPLTFDVAVKKITEDSIIFNTGKTWKNFDYDAHTFEQLLISADYVFLTSDDRAEFDRAFSAITYNESAEYSDEEYILIAALNPQGVRIRMTYEPLSVREEVFEYLTGQDNKYYQHTGILWWTTWKEVAKGTEGGFFSGKVLTEADINLSMFEYQLSVDFKDTINAVAIIGAFVFSVYLVENIIPVITYEASAVVWYVRTFGIINGLSMYMSYGSQLYGTPNSVIAVLEADASDGHLDSTELFSKIDIGNKIEYLMGNATGSEHNIERSTGLYQMLCKIGLYDNELGRSVVTQALEDAGGLVSQGTINPDTGRVIVDTLLSGPYGFLQMRTIWEGTKLITVFLYD